MYILVVSLIVVLIILILFQVDSIYYLRRPHDLVAFLKQHDYRELITDINAQLVALQLEITDKVQQSTLFQVEIMYHTECLIYYSVKEEDMYSTIKDKKYFNRINTKRINHKNIMNNNANNNHQNNNYNNNDGASGSGTANAFDHEHYPICEDVPFSMALFEHLESMGVMRRKRLTMSPEIKLHADEFGILKESFVRMLALGLKQEPLSWKYALLSSYFWRAKGNARRAVECARRAIYLAPRKYLDIPFLSLGTILQRSNRSRDALVLMQAAVDHANDVIENHIGLGNALFYTSDFHGAMKHYEYAAHFDDHYAKRLEFLRKSTNCFRNIKMKLKEIERQVEEVFSLLDRYKANQTKLEEYLGKVLNEQVPIGKRLADPSFDAYSHQLLQRGQYCTTKMLPDAKEPILFCDFYTDLQQQLEKEDLIVDIVHHFADAAPKFIENFSLGVYRYLDIEHYVENASTTSLTNGGSSHMTNRANDESMPLIGASNDAELTVISAPATKTTTTTSTTSK